MTWTRLLGNADDTESILLKMFLFFTNIHKYFIKKILTLLVLAFLLS